MKHLANDIAAAFRAVRISSGDRPVDKALTAIQRTLLEETATRVATVLAAHGVTKHPRNFIAACLEKLP